MDVKGLEEICAIWSCLVSAEVQAHLLFLVCNHFFLSYILADKHQQ